MAINADTMSMKPQTATSKVIAVTDREELERWGEQWNDLALQTPGASPMSSFAYYSAWLDCRLRPSDRWVCALAHQDSRLVGVMPLLVEKRKTGPLAYTALISPFSVEPLVADDADTTVPGDMARSALKAVPEALAIELRHLRADRADPWLNETTSLHVLRQFDCHGKAVDTSQSLERWEAGLKAKHRREVKRLYRKLMELPEAREQVAKDEQEARALTEAFIELEASGWKGEGQTAIRSDSADVAFYKCFVRRLAALGACEWHLVRAQGRVLSMHLVLRGEGMLFMPKTAFCEEYRHLGPGQIGHWLTIKRAIEDPSVVKLDFMSAAPWLDVWQVEQYDYLNLYLYPRRWRSRVLGYWPRRLQQKLSNAPDRRRDGL
jgi:CelD/BcsL family acetyltransferase involved in cellulose biosynthesis